MSLILSLETSTKACSVVLARDGVEIDCEEIISENFTHSENLTVFIERIFQRQEGLSVKNLDAVAVSAGPGSYTGLRIGSSTAKGLCYSLEVPFIAIDSLQALANRVVGADIDLICPMFDARRMEVYTTVYDQRLSEKMELQAMVLDADSFSDILDRHGVLFLGPGAHKASEIIDHPNARFDLETTVSAKGMVSLSQKKFELGKFEDTAYFEPNYLKSFIAGTPKKHF